MANKPAAEIENLDETRLDDLDPGSPQYQDKKRLIAETKKRKKNSVVVGQWIEYHHTNAHVKGGKVLLKKKMKNGNVHSFYLGRLKRGGKEAVEVYKKKGVEVTVGGQYF